MTFNSIYFLVYRYLNMLDFNYDFTFQTKNVHLYYRILLKFNLILPNVKVMTLEEILTLFLLAFAKYIFVNLSESLCFREFLC